MTPSPASLYVGRTVHQRETPFQQRFSYKIALLDIDLDALEAADRQSRFFSVDKHNLMSLRFKDYGPRDGSSLKDWGVAKFEKAGVDLGGGKIRLTSFPRMWGYAFAPLSLWFGYEPEGALRGVIYEVHNTFGEQHAYVAAAPDASSRIRQAVDKAFHVSPFFDIDGRYRFTLRPPDDRLNVVVENVSDAGRTHMANIIARRTPLSDFRIAALLAKMPFMAHGVTAGIHWEALKLWLRGAGYRSKPPTPKQDTSIARLETKPPRAALQ